MFEPPNFRLPEPRDLYSRESKLLEQIRDNQRELLELLRLAFPGAAAELQAQREIAAQQQSESEEDEN
jgi:hypothetical protein